MKKQQVFSQQRRDQSSSSYHLYNEKLSELPLLLEERVSRGNSPSSGEAPAEIPTRIQQEQDQQRQRVAAGRLYSTSPSTTVETLPPSQSLLQRHCSRIVRSTTNNIKKQTNHETYNRTCLSHDLQHRNNSLHLQYQYPHPINTAATAATTSSVSREEEEAGSTTSSISFDSSASLELSTELEGLSLLVDQTLREFESMVQQQSTTGGPTTNKIRERQPEPDDGLARELKELERSERSLRRELQVLSSTDKNDTKHYDDDDDDIKNYENDNNNDGKEQELSLQGKSIYKGNMQQTAPTTATTTDHPDIAAGPPPAPIKSKTTTGTGTDTTHIKNPFDMYVGPIHPSNNNEKYIQNTTTDDRHLAETDASSEVGTDISINTAVFLAQSPPAARQRIPSDGDEQVAPRNTAASEDGDDDGMSTVNRGLPLAFDPDTYSYDAEVDAILHPQNNTQDEHNEDSTDVGESVLVTGDSILQDITEGRHSSAAYTTSEDGENDGNDDDDDASMAGNSGVMLVAPPYLSDQASSANRSVSSSSSLSKTTKGASNTSKNKMNRTLVASAVISPAVTALSLAQGSSSGDENDTVISVQPTVSSGDMSISDLAASATPLVLPDQSKDYDTEQSSSVHSFSLRMDDEEKEYSLVADCSTLGDDKENPDFLEDQEVGSAGDTHRTLQETNNGKKKAANRRRSRCSCCKGVSWSDRCKLLLVILFWIALACMVYFLITWSLQENDDEDTPLSTEEPDGAPTTVPATPAPTTIVDTLYQFLAASSFDEGAALRNSTSPQFKAYEWLTGNVNLANYSESKILTRYSLATFYWSTGGNTTWLDDASWLSDEDECDWFTRSRNRPCNFQGAFQDLQMSYNNLNGLLPPELGLLSNSLVTINIGGGPNNAIGSTLPSELGYLTNLQELRLPNNVLSSSLPTEIGRFINIRTIDLRSNRLQGAIPEEIGAMTDLFSFSAENNVLSGPIPTTIGNLVRLKTLTLSSNRLTSIPTHVGVLTDLVFLKMQENAFVGPLPTEIGQLAALRLLQLNNNTFDQTMPREIALLPALTEVDLSYNYFRGQLPPFGDVINQIRILNLSHNALTGTVPLSFANLTGVQTLFLEGNDLWGIMPDVVCDTFGRTFPTVFVDCTELTCPCCNFCCTDGISCSCQFANTTEEWQCL